ncbi:hypothetical protein ACSTS3_16990 [Aquimarina muelleri]|uniref:hypothetical protein n=1 Tax=Aquimarina muelleri TaxID=279356 RepID=UPI003F6866B7
MKKSRRQRVEELLLEERDILCILPLERKLGFSRGIIYKFIKNKRRLNSVEIKKIDNYFLGIIEKYQEE